MKHMKKIYSVLKKILTVFLVLMLLVILVQKFSKNSLSIGGIRIFTIASDSMKPKYEIGDILILKNIEAKDIKVGNDVTYMGTKLDLKGLVITHRVIEKSEKDGKYYFKTKGIANEYEDPEISEDDIYGKVAYKTVFFSFLGRLMNNTIVYYGFFIAVGVSISYQLIYAFFIKEDDEEEENE